MGLLAKAKERHKERISRQFISFYDSVLYLGEPIKDALEFITDNLRNNQTHIRLEHGELYLISVKRYQDDEDERNYFTGDYIEKHLVECINQGFIDETSPIYNLGFAKKSYIEMLISYGIPITENERINTQSPDLAFDDEYFEIDYYTFEMVVADRDDLRTRLEKQQALMDNLITENEKLKTELESNNTCEQVKIQGYLDPSNSFFSIEMKLCHDTWTHLYENGNNSRLPHTTQAINYLESYPDFNVNTKAISRIKTVTNPKRSLAKGETNEDI